MKHVLLVDDNLTLLKQVALQLSDLYRVSIAKSGRQALVVAARTKPDLILLDIEMPEMDGFATIRALKDNHELAHIPVIFLTANHNAETQVMALESGGVDFIKKPFEKGVLLHRIELHLRLSQYQLDLEKTVRELEDGIIVSFAEIIECRDSFNANHLQKTRSYVELIGQLLLEKGEFGDELDALTLNQIARASVLHDVGKIGVSDQIMFKPGIFTADEYAAVKKHATIGANTLEEIFTRTPMPMLRYAIEIAKHHHERFDGLGYPDGLKGEEIPLCARIVAVANVYDSLVSDSVYRPAKSHEEACRIIAKSSGSEFDPRIVTVFLEHNAEFAATLDDPEQSVPSTLTTLPCKTPKSVE